MFRRCTPWYPEIGIVIIALVFALRELGTFPTAWADDSLFMIVARNLTTGQGYALPVLQKQWYFPYILAVGPTVIAPAALSMKLFGLTVAAARFPMVLYLLGTACGIYLFTLHIVDRATARWSLLLLVTLSAFINTGKPVLGEIPGFFFLLAGLLAALRTPPSWRTSAIAGTLLGLSIITKLTYGIAFVVLVMTGGMCLIRKQWHALHLLTIMLLFGGGTFLLLGPTIGLTDAGFFGELNQYAIAEGGSGFLNVLRTKPTIFLRLPFLAFGVILLLGSIGLWQKRHHLTHHVWFLLCSTIALFVLYFLNNNGWYRHLLPAHLLLLPFVPVGARRLFGQKGAAGILTLIVILQSLWQLDHRGSTRSTEAAEAAAVLQKNYSNRSMVILHPELFFLLPKNPNWLFLSEELQWRTYARFEDLPLTQEKHCLPLIQKLGIEQLPAFAGRLENISGRYHIIRPPPSCRERKG